MRGEILATTANEKKMLQIKKSSHSLQNNRLRLKQKRILCNWECPYSFQILGERGYNL